MDAFLKKIERLAAMASTEPAPAALDVDGVMAKIRGIDIAGGLEADAEDDGVLSLPLRFWAGGAAAAAVVALAVSLAASTAWTELTSPMAAAESLFNVLEAL